MRAGLGLGVDQELVVGDPEHPHVGLDVALAVEQGRVAPLAGGEVLGRPDDDAHRVHLVDDARPLRDGLRSVQLAFREASVIKDAPGAGPGEKYTGPVN